MIYIVNISKLNVFWYCRNPAKGYYNEYLVLSFDVLFLSCYRYIIRVAYKPQGGFIFVVMTADTCNSHAAVSGVIEHT